jgi:chorismate dehydratase
MQLVERTPARLNDALRLGEVEMGFISSFEYLLHSSEYVLLPDLSISATGRVSSILLFHHVPLEQLADARIALADTSATSVHLLRILLETERAAAPQYVRSAPDLHYMLGELQADAGLLIGDDAIRASYCPPTRYVTDLGAWWHARFGHSMTYAVWAVRASFAAREPRLLAQIHSHLLASRTRGLQHLEHFAEHARRTIGGDTNFWESYFRQLQYGFGAHEQAGLRAYHQSLLGIGIPLPPFQLHFWNPSPTNQVTG